MKKVRPTERELSSPRAAESAAQLGQTGLLPVVEEKPFQPRLQWMGQWRRVFGSRENGGLWKGGVEGSVSGGVVVQRPWRGIPSKPLNSHCSHDLERTRTETQYLLFERVGSLDLHKDFGGARRRPSTRTSPWPGGRGGCHQLLRCTYILCICDLLYNKTNFGWRVYVSKYHLKWPNSNDLYYLLLLSTVS